mmetsp:Transcript_75267/g.200966  ORF Transcript_75267/g.200966 Transcript_75267/m.200966 type:complete len:173 (+) Transcript_75267:383-901(+)
MVLVALVYRTARDPASSLTRKRFVHGDFQDGVLDCLNCCTGDADEDSKRFEICLCSFCCTGIRWADSVEVLGIVNFWAGLALWLLLFSAGLLYSLLGFFLVAVGAYTRSVIRTKYKMTPPSSDAGKCGQLCVDSVLWWLCTPCAVAQEARQVEAGKRASWNWQQPSPSRGQV